MSDETSRRRKNNPVSVKCETRAKNLLKVELMRRRMTYEQLPKKLGTEENELTLNNVITRGDISTTFFLHCTEEMGAKFAQLR